MGNTLFYPLRGPGFWVIGGFALLVWVLLTIVSLISTQESFAGFMAAFFMAPAVFLLCGIMINYALVILSHTARGHPEPPTVDLPDLNPVRQGHVVMALIVAMAVTGMVLSSPAGTMIRALLTVGVVVLGSSVGTLTALNNSVLAGFNPGEQIRLLRGLGGESPGLLVVGVAWLMLAAALTAGSPNLLGMLGVGYLFVLAHHLAGRLLFRNRLDLELDTDQSPEQTNAAHWAAKDQAFRAMLVDLHRLCATDRVAEAFKQLASYLDADEGLDEASVYLTLKDFHDPRLRLEHSYHYITRLARNRQRHRAWQVLHDAVAEDQDFRPASDELLISLLDEATPDQASQVEVLLKDFEQRYPDSHLQANALFRLASVRIDHLGGHAEGLALLERIAKEHPEFAGQQRFRDYRSRQDNAAT
jgi:hypothetical protein